MNDNNQLAIDIISGKQKKDPSKEWQAVKITIGSWTYLIFPKSKFEMDYIKTVLETKK